MTKHETFERIYAAGGWDGQGSGPGSTEEFTLGFRAFLADQLTRLNPAIVVDLGCGDWQWQQHMDWGEREYVGIDLVGPIIRRNVAQFAHLPPKPNFFVWDILLFAREIGLSACPGNGRLIIVKDVLHHMPPEDVNRLVEMLSDEEVLWVVDVTDSGTVVGPDADVCRRFFGGQPAFEFERPPTYRYGRKVAFLQERKHANS